MTSPAGPVPDLRLPWYMWVGIGFFLATFIYSCETYFLRVPVVGWEQHVVLGLAVCLFTANNLWAMALRSKIEAAIPRWLRSTWVRIPVFVAILLPIVWAIQLVPLPEFYRQILCQSVFFLTVPCVAFSRKSTLLTEFKGTIAPERVESDEDLVLPYNRRMALITLICGVGFVTGAIVMRHEMPVLSWIVGIFFGLCGVIGLLMLIPGCSEVELTREGLVMVNMWRRYSIRWDEVSEFSIVAMQSQRAIGCDLVKPVDESSSKWRKQLAQRKWVKESYGKDMLIVASQYRISTEDLCYAMNERRARALGL